jgi:hypothetical protein
MIQGIEENNRQKKYFHQNSSFCWGKIERNFLNVSEIEVAVG